MFREYWALLGILALAVSGQNQRECPAGHFQCSSGQCISLAWKCDGYLNCDDGSDEVGCDYGTCPPAKYQCASSSKCIPLSWLCDGWIDCPNNDDETTNCPPVTCASDEFQCQTGICIWSSWQCDFYDDCGDNSDEQGCEIRACTDQEWRCDNGECIEAAKHCNGVGDCMDGSDENNCTDVVCHPSHTQCGSGECVLSYYVCDHHSDCWDASDEVNCTHAPCTRGNFTCDSGQCIDASYVCDAIMDCNDASDEINCVGTFSCPPQQWPCYETLRKCIPVDLLCDGRQDCPNGEDERAPCNTYSCGFLSCEYQCHAAPNGGTCYCDAGYVVSSDNRTCEDFDECSHWGYCEQGCVNSPSSYECSCQENYLLEANGHCRSFATDIPFLLVSSGQTITRSSLSGHQSSTIATTPQTVTPGPLAYHYGLGKIFYSSTSEGKIYSCNFRGGNPNPQAVLQLPGNLKVSDLAVDWVSNKLYLVEKSVNRIEVAQLDGSHRSTVIGSNLESPSGLAIDPVNGYMFFGDAFHRVWYSPTDEGENQKIERSFMDGSHRFELTNKKVYTISGLAADIPARRIYWVDHVLDCLVTMTYDGHQRYTILQGGLVLPNSWMLAIFERYAFIADHTRDAVLRADRFDWAADTTVTLPGTAGEANGLSVYHSSLQPSAPNPCGTDNGGCQHLCVITRRSDNQGIGYQCKCDIGYHLNPDLTTCSKVTSFLLLSTFHSIRGLPLNRSGENDCMQPFASDDYLQPQLQYDAAAETIYFASYNALWMMKTDGTNTQKILTRHFDWSASFAYDWMSKNFYWSNMGRGLIAVLKMDGIFETETVVVQNSSLAIGEIAVTPLHGYLFMYDRNTRSLQKAWLDGTHMELLLNPHQLNTVRAFSVDHRDRLLFWSSHVTDSIWHCDFLGYSITEVDTQQHAPWSMAVFGDYVYFGDKGKIYRVNKTQGSWLEEVSISMSSSSFSCVNVYSTELQTMENQCLYLGLNGDCSHFCFGTPQRQRTCGCPLQMKLAADQQSCVDDPDAVSPWDCLLNEWTCDEGSCITSQSRCDGYPDCPNGEDELNCAGECQTYLKRSCEDDPNVCVSWRNWCNDVNDCADGSDELNCTSHSCTDQSFHCQDGSCIPNHWRCDTDADCPDGSDEVDCEGYTCPPDQFSCVSVSRCIPRSKVCNTFNDCGDRSDEENCLNATCTDSYMFQCAIGSCIPFYWQCDGQEDCSDGSDEHGCTGCSSDDEFRCDSGLCIRSFWRCDGIVDCDDGSDEPEGCTPEECDGLRCDNYCIAQDRVCDGYVDCVDQRDETGCPTPTFACPAEHWQCPGTNQCVSFDSVCDVTEDCPNGEDEGPRCNEHICSQSNGGCSDICIDTPFGAECGCPVGYVLNNMRSCEDLDECTIADSCSQECSNRRGSFVCLCSVGYLLEPDGRTCKVTDPATPFLIVTSRRGIQRYDIPWNEDHIIHSSGWERISSADFDSVTGNIYFSNSADNTLYQTNINGTETQPVYSNGMEYVEAIAVDWVGRNIYWSDTRINIIEVASLDRDHRTVLITQNISRPRGLCLDPSEGSRYLFWADWDQHPRLERASMDGQDRMTIVSEDLYWPNGIALDLPTKKLYFGDGRLDFIDSCNYDGSGRRRVVMRSSGDSNIHSITIFEDFMYWTDKGNHEILRAKKFNGENMTVYIPYVYSLRDVHAFHPAKQPPGPNPCSSNSCSHLCVLSTNDQGYSCLCPVGQTLQADGSCSMAGVFLLVVRGSMIQGISLDPTDQSLNHIQTVTAARDAYDVDFDQEQRFMYWSEAVVEGHEEDNAERSIKRAEFDGFNSSTEFVPTAYIGSPVGIAIDYLSRNIYWTNPDKHTIEVMQLDGDNNYRLTVVENSGGETSIVFDPAAICLDPGSGMMYWAENGGMGVAPQINRANMDGSALTAIVSENLGHVDFMTLDIEAQKLYWTESISQSIERCNVDGSGRETVVEGVHHGMGIAVYQNYLYYADSAYEKIMRVDKATGQNPVEMRSNVRRLKGMRIFARPGPTSNGCSTSNGGCQHLCLPTGPSARVCACTVGFILNTDGVTCGNLSSFAVVSQLQVTRGFGLEGSDHPEAMVPIGGRTRYTLHVDVYTPEGYIYFADYDPSNRHNDRNGIRRIRADGSGFQNIALTGLGYRGTRGITVDWIAGNVYWSSVHEEESYVEVSRLDGSLRLILWKTPTEKPRTLAVNPIKRYLYWADYGQRPKIVRAFLDGSNRTELATVGVAVPRDICVDIQTHDVFWVDTITDVLEKMDWQGGNRQIVRSQLPNPFGLAVFRDSVYWVDRSLEKIFQASKLPNSNKDPDVFRSDMESLRDIAIFDASNQPPADDNICGVNNGGCDQLCFAMPDGVAVSRICTCAIGELADDGQTCRNSSNYLVVGSSSGFSSLNFDPRNHAVPWQPIEAGRSYAFAIHSTLQRIYWVRYFQLSYVSVRDGVPVEVQQIAIEFVWSMAIDRLHNRIYIVTGFFGNSAYTVDLDGNNLVQIPTAPDPRIIVLNPCEGVMYYTTDNWRTTGIYNSSLGGSHPKLLVSFVGSTRCLAIDYTNRWLYYSEDNDYSSILKRVKLDGSVQESILDNVGSPAGMVVHGDYLYYISTGGNLKRVEKDTGGNPTDITNTVVGYVYNLEVFHDEQPTCTTSPCDIENGGCSDICHPGQAGTRTCACPQGLLLKNEQRICVPANATCTDTTQFTCADGSCIPMSWACDVDNDCGDWSDENPRFCYDHTCESSEFLCNNGRCIPSTWRCDYDNDCRDNTDENGCPFPTCEPGDYTCPSSRCIPMEYLCDGDNDCRDANYTDERNCPEVTCRPGYVSCPNNHICIHSFWRCDGDNDCLDNSDENPLYCQQEDCPSSSHRCDSGQCISGFWLCDDEVDCLDQSDEGAFCNDQDFTCAPNFFTCDNKNCIHESWICDTDNDCGDGSDEDERHNCDTHQCAPEYYTCRQNRPNRNRCIPQAWLCDGFSDCEHADDEDNCTRTTCVDGQFTCDNGLCILDTWECDHDNDCGDQSDEGAHCDYRTCDDNEFTCNNGRCIPANWICDGDNDCRDLSDEQNCATSPPCGEDQFTCLNGECILDVHVCDKTNDCLDMSDETHCDINECLTLEANQCEYFCNDTRTGYFCSCPSGYTLNDDGKTCRDNNECNEIRGVCSQLCENTRGSYFCKCADGYAREMDLTTCKHTEGGDGSLIFSNRYYIRQLSLDGQQYDLIKDGLFNVIALDYDLRENRLYYLDTGTDKISRMFLNGTGVEVIVPYAVTSGQGLALDWVGRKLYWLETSRDVMEVCQLDGTFRKTIVYQDMSQPRGIALDPRNGTLYWTDWGLRSYIGRMGMDGSSPMRLINEGLVWPNGLTVCYACNKLYWADAHLNYIGYSNLDGSYIHKLPGEELAHPFAVTVFEDYVYWTDWNHMGVYRANKSTGANRTLIREVLHRPFDIHVFHPLRQDQSLVNPCGTNNGGCSHLCLLSPGGGFTCACPDNFIFHNSRICQANCSALQYRCADNSGCIPLNWKCDTEADCPDGSDEPDSCPVRHCNYGYFQCDNLNCTTGTQLCNGVDECGDGSDERMCDQTHCQPWEFRCASGNCILHTLVCNQRPDCADGSDENTALCQSRTCSPGYFQCDNGFCIPEAWHCDLDDDCGDNSDEPHRFCQQVTCPAGWEACQTNYRCIPSWAFCDGYDNCRDNSDEQNCEDRTCEPGTFRCGNHECIPQRWVCDFEVDCVDGSDEAENCPFRSCSESEFHCDTQQCIPKRWVCDHDDDCGDLSDESACEDVDCQPGYVKCRSGHCIRESYVCDGDRDCLDYSDEENCPTRLPGGLYCFATEFTCNNTLCIWKDWVCDGDNDCGDGSDEELSICAWRECDENTHYRCHNGLCIPLWKTCDGYDDCRDASDENNHEFCAAQSQCQAGEYKCPDDSCIPGDYVCDEYDDCGDASDEMGCNDGTCAEAICEELCQETTTGHICTCQEGHQVGADHQGCEDINECQDNPCPQLCRNTKGSYYCQCASGYTDRGERGMDCKPNGDHPTFVFGDGSTIRRYDNTTKKYTAVTVEQGLINDVDYHRGQDALYWVDIAHSAVKRARFPANEDQDAIVQKIVDNLNIPRGVAVDWIGGNVYWTDLGVKSPLGRRRRRQAANMSPRVAVAKADGRYVRDLVTTDLGKPSAIAVNPFRGLLYWTDIGVSPKIEMAWMNGARRKTVVSDRISVPTGLTIDFANYDTVYFCDNKENRIESMSWNGENRKLLKQGYFLENPFQLEVFGSFLHFTTEPLDFVGKILNLDKLGRGVPTTFIDNIALPNGLVVRQAQRYPEYDKPNPCDNNPCSHLCLLIPEIDGNHRTYGYTCQCPNGDVFQPDSTSLCTGAQVEPDPLPGLPVCQCQNGGLCISPGKCECPSDYVGDTCEKYAPGAHSGGPGGGAIAAIIVVLIIIITVLAVLAFVFIRRYRNSSKPGVDATVSYRGGANIEMPTQHPATDGSGITQSGTAPGNFENPVYNMQSPTLQAVGQYENVNPTAQAEALPPKVDVGADPTQAGPLPEKTGLPTHAYTPTEAEGDTNALVTKDKM